MDNAKLRSDIIIYNISKAIEKKNNNSYNRYKQNNVRYVTACQLKSFTITDWGIESHSDIVYKNYITAAINIKSWHCSDKQWLPLKVMLVTTSEINCKMKFEILTLWRLRGLPEPLWFFREIVFGPELANLLLALLSQLFAASFGVLLTV